jgi:hypothetical protein
MEDILAPLHHLLVELVVRVVVVEDSKPIHRMEAHHPTV